MSTQRFSTAGIEHLDFDVEVEGYKTVAGPWIVIPTYNEIENLPKVLGRLLTELRRAVGLANFSILVVDDGSPDGTGELADELASDYPEVQVLHRTAKNGLGRAYLAGFRIALDHGATHVIQMDADLSHAPEDVPNLLAVAEDADLVLGSRYVRGGATPDWGLQRKILSRGGSFYARNLLGLPVRDLTGGFKCWSRKTLQSLGLEQVSSEGYVFQIEMTYRAVRGGARVAEMPIVFNDRTFGESKMSGSIVKEALLRVPQLRFAKRDYPRGNDYIPALPTLDVALAES
ncbi:polyprenol monophosphomannose synthase [Solirubrobacter soli]|uniref:polyprenol monophosphomannose synthase n=1 Tax=Solirubrobacter soli TaxID=363832 RepID=UPI000417F6D7|nr:polyprenol monophosphomannose synthase [Solirubrobacter soli]